MNEDADYKGPKEDCVEECTLDLPTLHSLPAGVGFLQAGPPFTDLLCPSISLSSTALRSGVRSAQTIQSPQMKPVNRCGLLRLSPTLPALLAKQATRADRRSTPSSPVQDSIAYCRSNGFQREKKKELFRCRLCTKIELMIDSLTQDGHGV